MIGSNLGRTFLFSEQNPSFNSYNNQAQAENIPFDTMVGDALSGIEQTDNMTNEYYAQWAQLKSFAKTAWNEFGVDITSPNVDNEEQMRLHSMFMKGLAAVKSMGNTLKRGAEMEDLGMQMMLTNPDVVDMGKSGGGGEYTTSSRYANTGLTSEDEEIVKFANRSVNSIRERDEINEEKNNYVVSLLSELENTTDPNERKKLSSRISALKNIKATYDPSFNLSLGLQRKRQNSGKDDKVSDVEDMWLLAKKYDKSVIELLESNPNLSNVRYVTPKESGSQRAYITAMRKTTSGTPEQVSIDISNDKGGYRLFGSLFTEIPGWEALDEKIDTLSLDEETARRNKPVDLTEKIDEWSTLLSTESPGLWGIGSRSDEYAPSKEAVKKINNSLSGEKIILPEYMKKSMDMFEKDEDSAEVQFDKFFVGSRTGNPYVSVSYLNYKGERVTKDFKATKKNIEEFLSLNAYILPELGGNTSSPGMESDNPDTDWKERVSEQYGSKQITLQRKNGTPITVTVQSLIDSGKWSEDQILRYINNN